MNAEPGAGDGRQRLRPAEQVDGGGTEGLAHGVQTNGLRSERSSRVTAAVRRLSSVARNDSTAWRCSKRVPGRVAQVEDVDDPVADGGDERLPDVEVEVDEHRRDAREETDVVGRVHLDHGRRRRRVGVDEHPDVAVDARRRSPVGTGGRGRGAARRARARPRARRSRSWRRGPVRRRRAQRSKRSRPVNTSSAMPSGWRYAVAVSMSKPTQRERPAAVASSPVRSGATTVHAPPLVVERGPLDRRRRRATQELAMAGELVGRERARVRRGHGVEELVGVGVADQRRGQRGAALGARRRRRRRARRARRRSSTNSSRTSAALLVFHAAGPVARESPIVSA